MAFRTAQAHPQRKTVNTYIQKASDITPQPEERKHAELPVIAQNFLIQFLIGYI